MLSLRTVIAQVHRSIGSRRNFSTSPPVTSSKKEVPTFPLVTSVITGYGGWNAFLLYKDYKDKPRLWRELLGMTENSGHHEKDQVPKVKGRGKLLEDESTSRNTQQESLLQKEIETMKKRQSLLQEEIEAMKKRQSLLLEEIETMKKRQLEKKNF